MPLDDDRLLPARVGRLEREIRAKRNSVLLMLRKREAHPGSYGVRLTYLRSEMSILQGMVFSWLYISGKWTKEAPISMPDNSVNDLAMYWLSVDLLDMHRRAYMHTEARHKRIPPQVQQE